MTVTIPSMSQGYARLLAKVRTEGEWTTSRGMRHKEILGLSIDLTDPTMCWASGTGRSLNIAIGVSEACQLVAGEAFPQVMNRVSKGAFERYMDGDVLHGSYGPRLRPQMDQVIRRFIADPGTRQAVTTIWDPLHDLQERRDIPCTISLQWLVRNGKLHMVTYMRSNDAWLGFPYDVFQFCNLQATLAWVLDLELGTYHHRVGSFHLYEEHIEASKEVVAVNTAGDRGWSGVRNSLSGTTVVGPIDRWRYARTAADMALRGEGRAGVSDDSRLLVEMNDVARR